MMQIFGVNSYRNKQYSTKLSGSALDVFQVPNVQLKLPGKKLFGNNLDPQFVQSRREGLNSFIQQIMTDARFRQL
jgi:hypothetical protein